jgi:putative FmdB family regulatory protein
VPTYEYVCRDCGHTFEKFQSITADPLEVCPVCYGRVERLISAGGGLIFKGSGFYITDYRSDDYKQKAKAESGETTSSSEKGDKKSDTKKTESTASKADSGKSD